MTTPPDGSALFRALGGHYTSPAQAVCEFIDDSLSSIAANGDEVGEVFLRVTDRGELVELSVTDSGSGIADLGAALTISDRSIAQTPYNEHGCGLKSALSHLCGGAEDWSIETRTAADAAADRYRCVSAPYAAVNAHMTERIYAGSGDIPWVTGTIVRLRCPMSRFAQLKPSEAASGRASASSWTTLRRSCAYTYAPLLAEREAPSAAFCAASRTGTNSCSPSTRSSRSGTAMPLSCRRRSSTSAAARSPSAAATGSSSKARATPSTTGATWRRAASRSA